MTPDDLTPQLRKILTHCKRAGYITNRAAMIDHGIMSLSRRISDLKQLGYSIRTELRKHPVSGRRYVRYYVDMH